jgi:predicted enzyme related to lactoylglutathione lyase
MARLCSIGWTVPKPGSGGVEARTQPCRSRLAGRREARRYRVRVTARFLIELPADEPERARRFWQGLLGATLDGRPPEEGSGWQGEYDGIVFGLHERGPGPGDRFSLPYFPVADLAAAVERVRALGGEIVHPGERWVICRDSEGTPFGLAGSA